MSNGGGKIDIKDLLGSVPALQSPGVRIGWPDDATPVSVSDRQRFSRTLDAAINAFRDLRRGTGCIVNADVNSYHSSVDVRFVQCGPSVERNGKVEPAFELALQSLRKVVSQNGGQVHYWGGNNYLDVSLPFEGTMREGFPEIDHFPWDERYRYQLNRAAWDSLRGMVFRFSDLAEGFADRCIECQMTKVLVPSVGLCVHPWLFADCGMHVIATDIAATALASLSEPARWPRLYSQAAFERWDIDACAMYASQGNPHRFTRMPDLQNANIRDSLKQRITFSLADWADLPIENGSVDAIFATNALPRESEGERLRVLREWARVIRPGGIVFIAQHNFVASDVESVLRDAGWVETPIIGGERTEFCGRTGFQVYYSSG